MGVRLGRLGTSRERPRQSGRDAHPVEFCSDVRRALRKEVITVVAACIRTEGIRSKDCAVFAVEPIALLCAPLIRSIFWILSYESPSNAPQIGVASKTRPSVTPVSAGAPRETSWSSSSGPTGPCARAVEQRRASRRGGPHAPAGDPLPARGSGEIRRRICVLPRCDRQALAGRRDYPTRTLAPARFCVPRVR